MDQVVALEIFADLRTCRTVMRGVMHPFIDEVADREAGAEDQSSDSISREESERPQKKEIEGDRHRHRGAAVIRMVRVLMVKEVLARKEKIESFALDSAVKGETVKEVFDEGP